jgi:hypothetical protein
LAAGASDTRPNNGRNLLAVSRLAAPGSNALDGPIARNREGMAACAIPAWDFLSDRGIVGSLSRALIHFEHYDEALTSR